MERKPLIKEKVFWLMASVFILYLIGLFYQNTYLQMPFAFTVGAFIPGIFIIGLSPNFSIKFVKIHKFFHKKNNFSYSFNEKLFKIPSSIEFAGKNSFYTITIMYTVLSWSGLINESFFEGSRITLILGISILSLFGGSILHASIYLLKYTGLMIENSNDSSRISLGTEMFNNFKWALSPLLILSLIYNVYLLSLNWQVFLIVFLPIVGVCTYSSFFSFYILKRRHFERMVSEITNKLKEIV